MNWFTAQLLKPNHAVYLFDANIIKMVEISISVDENIYYDNFLYTFFIFNIKLLRLIIRLFHTILIFLPQNSYLYKITVNSNE